MESISKIAKEIIASNLEHNVIAKAKKLEHTQRDLIDIRNVDSENIQKITKKLKQKGYTTYTSVGTLIVQKI